MNILKILLKVYLQISLLKEFFLKILIKDIFNH